MESKKGFTLIELIAIITFISLIILVGTPLILNQISTTRETKYETFVSDLCLATESYLTHSDYLDSVSNFNYPGDAIYINMSNLIESGYVKKTVVNPKTKEKINPADKLLVTLNENGVYTCELNADMPENVSNASQLMYDNSYSNLSCTNVQCALDEISKMIK